MHYPTIRSDNQPYLYIIHYSYVYISNHISLEVMEHLEESSIFGYKFAS